MVNFITYLAMYLDMPNKSISLGEFERHYKRPHQTIKEHLDELLKKKVLISERKGKFLFYSLNFKNPLMGEYLIMCEKERMLSFLEKNTMMKRLYELIQPIAGKSRIAVFGSAVNSQSFNDIDLLVISGNKNLRKILDDFMATYNIKVHVVQASEKSLSKAFIEELRKKHILLNEHGFFVRVLYGL